MRQGKVFYKNKFAGIIKETTQGEYMFQYDKNYILSNPNDFITFEMPVREQAYADKRLFPFFDGLIPEGWLLDIASKNWKLNKNDRMGLLLTCCKDCIGAVSVEPIAEEDDI